MALGRPYLRSRRWVLSEVGCLCSFLDGSNAITSSVATCSCLYWGGVQSYLYANRVGFFVGKLELLLVPALPYLLLLAPVVERYRAHSLLDITDLQLGPIQARLLAHQLSDALALFFFTQVSRDLLLCVSYRTLYATTASVTLLSPSRSGVGLSLLGCGYASVGESIQPVRGKARAGVGSDVSSLQQFID